MSWGIGTDEPTDYGSDQAWGNASLNGVDVIDHVGDQVTKSVSARIPVDTYAALVMIGALALLWLLAGVLFKSVKV